ncbi:MAG: glycosyltransferase family 39 protein [Sandaracinaceae bacterium]
MSRPEDKRKKRPKGAKRKKRGSDRASEAEPKRKAGPEGGAPALTGAANEAGAAGSKPGARSSEATTPESGIDEASANEPGSERRSESTTDGSTTDRSTTDRSTTDRSTTDRSTTDRSTTDGSTTDGSAKPARKTSSQAKAAKSEATSGGKPPRASGRPDRAHIAVGATLAVLGFGATFLLMANAEQIPRGPLLGILTTAVGALGVLVLLSRRMAHGEPIDWRSTVIAPLEGEPVWMSPLVGVPTSAAIIGIGAAIAGYDGLPWVLLAGTVALVPAALRRPWLLAMVVASAILLPFLGVFGLWDPWETHYGEVAREIIARDDWISLWWAQEDWFWSKPILIFWMEALSMGALGVDCTPDANPAHPEWAIRLPHFLLVLATLSAVYAFVSRRWSRRAGLLACVVLATMPHFFLLAHQAITDMPFVANMTMAICMLGIALHADPDDEAKTYRFGRFVIGWRQGLVFALTMLVVPQILYLATRNVTFVAEFPPFGWHGDVFTSGSAGNHGVPGNSPVHNVEPFVSGPGAQPITQALLWLLAYLGLLFILHRERRIQSLAMFAFYVFCGLAFMAKGIPGFALPGLVALFWLIASRRWDLLGGGNLRVASGILTVITVGMPWYVAMYIRHGPPFTDRILIHDHINRLTAGVHGDTGSIEYFVEQMGYGMFPWLAIAPIAVAAWFAPGRGTTPRDEKRESAGTMVILWLTATFTLFNAMTTKFHHYIFPTVPPAAILVGVALDRLLSRENDHAWLARVGATALGVLAPIPVVLGVAGLWGDVRGVIPIEPDGGAADWVLRHPWSPALSVGLILLGVVVFAAAVYVMGVPREQAPRAAMAGVFTTGLLTGPPLLAMVGRDLSWVTDARPQGYERLIQLFVYNYGRPWPEELDYRPVLTGFAIVAVTVAVLAALRPLRDVATRALIGVAIAFAIWSLDVYMIDLSPHWGQRELIARYYEERASADEPLVAWQMNWKGENFYTGNHVAVFVQLDNRALREWLDQHPNQTVYFVLEHGRLNSLRGLLGGATVEELTDMRLCNKFILIRAHLRGAGAPRPAADNVPNAPPSNPPGN